MKLLSLQRIPAIAKTVSVAKQKHAAGYSKWKAV